MPLKIAVTGGAGFIGSQVAKRFIADGHRVTIIDNLTTGVEKNIPKEADFCKLDITDPKLEEIFVHGKFDVVDHHAAQIDVRKSVEDPSYDARMNILGSISLLENCRKYKVKKIIYVSTGGAVYGEPQYLPVDENHPNQPLAPYGISKHTVEHYIELYSLLYGLKYVILRYPNVYGPFQNPYGEAGVNAIFIGMMLSGRTPTIFGDGEQTRDYVYIDDVVEANRLALTTDKQGIFNLGWSKPISVNDICKLLQTITGFPTPPIHAPPRPGEVNHIYLKADRIKKELGWSPQISFEEGLRKTVDWFKQNPHWYPKTPPANIT
jgi:UDP-glucose 4-epimerase